MSASEKGDLVDIQSLNGTQKNIFTIGPKEFLFRYLRYIPWVIISVALFLLLAYLKVRYSTQIYRVGSSMIFKNDNVSSAVKDARFEDLFINPGSTNLNNEIQVLRSRPVLQRVARDLKLQTRYFNKGSVKTGLLYPDSPILLQILSIDSSTGLDCQISILDDNNYLINEEKTRHHFGDIMEKGGSRFIILRNPGINLSSVGNTTKFEVNWLPMPYVIEGLIGQLAITQLNEQSTILTMSFESENTNLGKDVLNTLMAVYDSLIVEDKNRIAGNTLRFINQSLFELTDTLNGVQGNLKNFMTEYQAFDLEGQSKTYMDKLNEAASAQSALDVKIGVVEFMLKYISNSSNIHELVPTNMGIEEPALAQLVSEYNTLQLSRDNNLRTSPAGNPMIQSMDNALDKIRRDIYQALLNVKQGYQISADNLAKRDQELQGNITSLPGKSMQKLNIERRQKILEELYSLLLQKRLEISLSSASTVSNSRVLEPAIAGGQVSPDNKKIYIFYLMIGLLIPVGIIVVREVLQDKVNGRADVEKNTNTPILGEIGHSMAEQPLVVTHNSRRLIAEQFRIVRTNLQYMIAKKDRPVIMITSSFSGEGKSFISTNIGAVMALSGKKTVIMEFDIRKPKIVSGLDLKRKMGITNYIIGKASFEELLVKVDGVENLYVIPCGPIPPNPAELLLDRKLDELMQEVKANFEIVIMDTAPVGLVSDAANLGRYADTTLYIVRQGHTFRKQIGMIDDLYINKKLPNLCVLLNDVHAEGSYYGGYYGSYGYYAGYGYGADSGYFEREESKAKRSFGRRIKRWFSTDKPQKY
jgi:tyrosine-protein kinase Etk/Wzc